MTPHRALAQPKPTISRSLNNTGGSTIAFSSLWATCLVVIHYLRHNYPGHR